MNVKTPEVAVIGGGVIGCSIAYHLASEGVSVTLLEKDRIGEKASSAAAGMLGAQVESGFPGPMVDLCLASREMFPSLARELKEKTGLDIEWDGTGLLRLAGDPAEGEELRERGAWQREQGETAEWWDPKTLLRREPALGEGVAGGLFIPGDSQVSAPRLVQALARGASLTGAELLEGAEVRRFRCEGGRIRELETSAGRIHPEKVVFAAGAWSGILAEAIGLRLPVVPVKGESLALRWHRPLFRRTLFAKGCYLVPKADGRVIVGATELPGDTSPGVSAKAVHGLLREAVRLVPGLGEADWERAWSGLRPGTPDGLPYLGRAPEHENLWVACGHFRNGILLSAATGRGLADLLLGRPVPRLNPFSPGRVLAGERR
ncbi:glycine oxidase [Melghirimyces profundicolus]|uniref:glycine oxidase n=1 Tax=Melghirimyces profundicolus TaxID=1242148 RepID=A0A2T6C9C9_9BACL|nr:glycine oxidase ThiO [Melghirimyces profundicolus]PTX64922.1 glycine oxidase [Melghirimyces profundicolus]